jgi:lactadherin
VNLFSRNYEFILINKINQIAQDQWLEIDVGHPTLITGLVTKGKGDTDKNHWVTKYKVSYSNDSILWTYYKDANRLEPKV